MISNVPVTVFKDKAHNWFTISTFHYTKYYRDSLLSNDQVSMPCHGGVLHNADEDIHTVLCAISIHHQSTPRWRMAEKVSQKMALQAYLSQPLLWERRNQI